MRKYIVIAKSEVMAGALSAVIPIFDQEMRGSCAEDSQVDIICVDHHFKDRAALFDRLAARLERLVVWNPAGNLTTTVLVDGIDVDSKAFMPLTVSWHGTIAMLVLAYPEVEWIFLAPNEFDGRERWRTQGLWRLAHPHVDQLFDAEGVRARILLHAQEFRDGRPEAGGWSQPAAHLTRRTSWGVAIDDECDYAYLHAYAIYRYGLRAIPVTSWSTAKRVLGASALAVEGEFALSVEDHYMHFPDCDERLHLSNHLERLRLLTRLQGVKNAICVTTGHRHADDEEALKSRNERFTGRVYDKPLHGILHVHEILRRDLGVDRGEYDFPGKSQDGNDAGDKGHSAPGRLLQTATHLVDRARSIGANSGGGTAARVRAAVMANLAVELLGGRTPTLSITALDLMNQLEIDAECGFGGFSYNISIDERMDAYRSDVRFLVCWYKPRRRTMAHLIRTVGAWFTRVRGVAQRQAAHWGGMRKRPSSSRMSALNAELMGLSHMRQVLAAHAQFDEERNVRMRQLRVGHELWRAGHFALGWILWAPMKYAETFLGHWKVSASVYVAVLYFLGWIYTSAETICGHALYVKWTAAVMKVATYVGLDEVLRAAAEAVRWMAAAMVMMGMGDSGSIPVDKIEPAELLKAIVMITAAASGVVNFGLLVAVFYESISRK